MARVYICDACGEVMEKPHAMGMKEFDLGKNLPDYDTGHVYREHIQKDRKIHLCPSCYHALKLISKGAKMPEQPASQTIRVRYLSREIEKLDYIAGKSDWVDLRAAEEVEMKQGEFKLIPLGIAMQLPAGYEGHMIPRSSTFKHFGIIQANHIGMIDESYCGDNDQWYFPAIALRDTVIHVNDRICQFRIVEHQPQLTFEAVDTLGNQDRGGIGSTGIN